MLHECIKSEKDLFLQTVHQWHQEGIEKIPLVAFIELLVPCILPLENHVREKIVNMVIRFGFQKCQQPSLAFLAEIQ
jgi:hypothetical protein